MYLIFKQPFRTINPLIFKDSEWLTFSMCKPDVRLRCNVGDVLVSQRCGPNCENVRIIWQAIVTAKIPYGKYRQWCIDNNEERRIFDHKSQRLADCIWDFDGYRTLSFFDTYQPEVHGIERSKYVIVSSKWSYFGPTLPYISKETRKLNRGFYRVESFDIGPWDVKNELELTGDVVLPKNYIDLDIKLPMISEDYMGYYNENGLRIVFIKKWRKINSHLSELHNLGYISYTDIVRVDEPTTIITERPCLLGCFGSIYKAQIKWTLIDGQKNDIRNRYAWLPTGTKVIIEDTPHGSFQYTFIYQSESELLRMMHNLKDKIWDTKLPKRRRPQVQKGNGCPTWCEKRKRYITNKKGLKLITSHSFGLYKEMYKKDPEIKENRNNKLYPELYEELCQLMMNYSPAFVFDCITLNKNIICQKHTDRYNKGFSYILFLGCFLSPLFFDDGRIVKKSYEFTKIDGSIAHHNKYLLGDKVSLIFFNRFQNLKATILKDHKYGSEFMDIRKV